MPKPLIPQTIIRFTAFAFPNISPEPKKTSEIIALEWQKQIEYLPHLNYSILVE
jgi:hypothetical protein